MDETMRRLNLAEEMMSAYRRDLGEHMVAGSCYGSVAHGRADGRSDLELIVLTDTVIEAVNVHTVRNGVQVECDVLPTERLRRAAQVVTIQWGIEADCYRYHRVIWDPTEQFAAVRESALATPRERFEDALQQSWWSVREWATKVAVMVESGNPAGAQFTARANSAAGGCARPRESCTQRFVFEHEDSLRKIRPRKFNNAICSLCLFRPDERDFGQVSDVSACQQA